MDMTSGVTWKIPWRGQYSFPKWEAAHDGRWTFRLISDLKAWCSRNHGNVSFHMTQFLTGHGCFQAYLKRFNWTDTDVCPICGQGTDNAEHAVLACDAWDMWKSEVCSYLGISKLTVSNIVTQMHLGHGRKNLEGAKSGGATTTKSTHLNEETKLVLAVYCGPRTNLRR
jgi:hypothetical protein